MAGTALDMLIAELLGDVGKLHDEVKELHGSVQAAARAEMRRWRRVAVLIVAASLVGGLMGGAAVMYWLGQH